MVMRFSGYSKTAQKLAKTKRRARDSNRTQLKLNLEFCYFFSDNTLFASTSRLFKLAISSRFSSILPSLSTYLA